jgi:hypothetical protein
MSTSPSLDIDAHFHCEMSFSAIESVKLIYASTWTPSDFIFICNGPKRFDISLHNFSKSRQNAKMIRSCAGERVKEEIFLADAFNLSLARLSAARRWKGCDYAMHASWPFTALGVFGSTADLT